MAQAAVSLHETLPAASMAEVAQADCIVILESDLLRRGADDGAGGSAGLANRGRRSFWWANAARLEQASAVSVEAITLGFIEEVPFAIFEKPVIICGTKNRIRERDRISRQGRSKAGLLPAAPTAFGAALLAGQHGATSLDEALATGKMKGIICRRGRYPARIAQKDSVRGGR